MSVYAARPTRPGVQDEGAYSSRRHQPSVNVAQTYHLIGTLEADALGDLSFNRPRLCGTHIGRFPLPPSSIVH